MISKSDLFIEKIKTIYSGAERVIEGINKKDKVTSFRINPNISNSKNVLKELSDEGFMVEDGIFPHSYHIRGTSPKRLSDSIVFTNNRIYIQSYSSMMPVFILNPQVDDHILDSCAAPGSKTTAIAQAVSGNAEIIALENNTNRFYLLKNTLLSQGYGDIKTFKTNAVGFIKNNPQYTNYFEKVLCDVPCSNEGTLKNISEESLKYWNPKKIKNLAYLQKKILANGINALKNNGILIYSTCTYSVEENEMVVSWALSKFPQVQLEQINLSDYLDKIPYIDGLVMYRNKNFENYISRTKRILPTEYFDGFYIAKFVKRPS